MLQWTRILSTELGVKDKILLSWFIAAVTRFKHRLNFVVNDISVRAFPLVFLLL